jgi:3-oxoacyl-[acyl-carrier protein] reductase
MSGARCLVLGGSGAVGGAVCTALAEEGARVAFTHHRGADRAEALGRRVAGSVALRSDLSSVAAVETVVDEAALVLGGLDAVVQCAGLGVTTDQEADPRTHVQMPTIDERAWDRMMNVNAKSTFFAVRRAAPILARAGGGNIVFIGSIDGVKPVPAPVHYAASKGALAGMTTALAKELGGAEIRVNMVAPGILEEGLSRDIPKELLAEYLKHCGLKRTGRLSEVARLVAWLALHNTYVTGQVMLVDGAL